MLKCKFSLEGSCIGRGGLGSVLLFLGRQLQSNERVVVIDYEAGLWFFALWRSQDLLWYQKGNYNVVHIWQYKNTLKEEDQPDDASGER